MADESGYDAGSDASLPSSGSEISFVEITKPCEVCGSNANDDEIMTCFFCRDTREHTYCSRVMKGAVPPMWICDECISSSTYQVVDSEVVHDQNMTSSDSSNQISATHDQPSQAHASPVAVPMDTSSGENQKPPSDSESAI
ncbi:unnamed protein product [Arabidopsis halleri]